MIGIALALFYLGANPCPLNTEPLSLGATGGIVVVYPFETHGSVMAKYDIVFVGDGFTETDADIAAFEDKVEQSIAILAKTPPYRRCAFNFYWVRLVSNESGADHPLQNDRIYESGAYEYPVCRDTPLNMTFGEPDEGINSYYHLYTLSEMDCLEAAEFATLDYDFVVVLVNDATYGGAAWPDQSIPLLAVSVGNGFESVLPHELGHKLASLGDEYDNQDQPHWSGCYPVGNSLYGGEPVSLPNVTANKDVMPLKWGVAEGVPIPTDSTKVRQWRPNETWDALRNTVGLWEGACNHYHRCYDCGIYRPQYTCLMREQKEPFCSVCSEAIRQKVEFLCPATPCIVLPPLSTILPLVCIPGVTMRVALPACVKCPVISPGLGAATCSPEDLRIRLVVGPLPGVGSVKLVDQWGAKVASSNAPFDDPTTPEVDPVFALEVKEVTGRFYYFEFTVNECPPGNAFRDFSLRVYLGQCLILSLPPSG